MKTGAKQTLDIAIAVPGLQFNGNTFSQQSLGGSESAAYYLARAFAVLGHRVTVFCNTEPVRCADVDYLPLAEWTTAQLWLTVAAYAIGLGFILFIVNLALSARSGVQAPEDPWAVSVETQSDRGVAPAAG